MTATTLTAGLGRRERLAVLASLLALAALAWLYLWIDAQRMEAAMTLMSGGMSGGMKMSMAAPWDPATLLMTFLMWSVMMVGMMLPSAAPAILLYAAMVRKNRHQGTALLSAWLFTSGYLAVWTGFSLAATLLQAGLEQAALMSPMMVSTSAWLSGGLLIVAGIYQWLPIKDVCLEKCRAPLQFFLMRWQPGAAGALRMGAEHGAFCVGCCWALMGLLFVAGVMNLLWVALIAGFVLAEKLLPADAWVGRWFGRAAGAAMILAGGALMI